MMRPWICSGCGERVVDIDRDCPKCRQPHPENPPPFPDADEEVPTDDEIIDMGHSDCAVCDAAREKAGAAKIRQTALLDELEARILKLPPERRSAAARTLMILRHELTESS
jgi:hypothetical protein